MSDSIRAVFLDRDGTIIEDQHYPREAEKVSLTPNAIAGLKRLVEKGYRLFVISNQSGVGRGLIADNEFLAVHQRCSQLLLEQKIPIEEYCYCLHRPEDHCQCRKPGIGLIPRDWNGQPFDFQHSFVVGDTLADLKLGEKLGARSYLVKTGKGKSTHQDPEGARFPIVSDLLEFSESIP